LYACLLQQLWSGVARAEPVDFDMTSSRRHNLPKAFVDPSPAK
jgi:hypothetical protein